MKHTAKLRKVLALALCFVVLMGTLAIVGCGEDEYVRSSLNRSEDEKMCREALTSVALCQPGSAGSTIRTYTAAVTLLDWSHQSGLTEEEFSDIFDDFVSTLGTGDLANVDIDIFTQSFVLTDEVARGIISGEISRQSVIDTIGTAPLYSAYELELYELYAVIISDTLAQYSEA